MVVLRCLSSNLLKASHVGGGGGCKLVTVVLKCKSNNVLRASHVGRGGVGRGGVGRGGVGWVQIDEDGVKMQVKQCANSLSCWAGVVWCGVGVVVAASCWWCYSASQTVCSQPLIIMLVEVCVCVCGGGGGGGRQVCDGVTVQITEAISSDPLMIY